MTEVTLLGALLVGLLGSTHCLGMCGGLAVATGHGDVGLVRLLAYNTGRLLSYAVIGAIAGLLGGALLVVMPQFALVLRLLAGALLIAMGLYISQWWMGLTRLEQVGTLLWRHLQPLMRGVLPVRYHWQALVLGLLWGWLPCGLVYSTVSWALATADWQQAALIMLAFGIGTLPAMIGVGYLNKTLLDRLRGKGFRGVAGVLIIAMGIWTALVPLQHRGHGHPTTPDHELKNQLEYNEFEHSEQEHNEHEHHQQ